ncbi:hypothetical protein [Flavisolibacter tropicus]|uniref:Uncharacterized protein n=1 Tax=Flavisolibacter tropicus TaxID=1492898 RepID=A0A172TR16_9BACT|nr:hypothetical protein [Flavisolibacter tropicus]ANE49470.1 hypothetical protein SY85_02105 [Flavisolibacter tropicus]
MTDKNRKWFAEPERPDDQIEQTSTSNDQSSQRSTTEAVDTSGDSSEIEDVQEDGTVAVGSGLGIDE